MPHITFLITSVNQSTVSSIPSDPSTSDIDDHNLATDGHDPTTTDPTNPENPSNSNDHATAAELTNALILTTSSDPPGVLNVLAFVDRTRTCSIIPPSDPTGVIVIPVHIHPDKSVTFPLRTGTLTSRVLDPLTGTVISTNTDDEVNEVASDAEETNQHSAFGETTLHPEGSPSPGSLVSASHVDYGKPARHVGFAGPEVEDAPSSGLDPSAANLWRLDTFLCFSCCSHKDLFTDFDTAEPAASTVTFNNDKPVPILGIGSVPVQFGTFKTTLRNVYFTPETTHNIISMRQLQDECNVEIMRSISGIELLHPRTFEVLAIGTRTNGGYFLRSIPPPPQTAEEPAATEESKPDCPLDSLNTWLLKRNIYHSITSSRVHFLDLTETPHTQTSTVTTPTGERIDIAGRGTISLRLGDLDVHLPSGLYVPDAEHNIISAEHLNTVQNISLLFEPKEVKITNRGTLCVLTSGPRIENGYRLTSSIITDPRDIPHSPSNIEGVFSVFPQPLHPPQDWFANRTYTISITPYPHLFTTFNVTRIFRLPGSLGGENWIVHGVGTVKLMSGNGQELELERVYYVPDARVNILSVAQVNREGHGSCHVGNGRCYLYKKRTGRLVGGGVWEGGEGVVEGGFRMELWPGGAGRQQEREGKGTAV